MRRIALVASLLLAFALPAHADDEDDDAPEPPGPAAQVATEPADNCKQPADLKPELVPAWTTSCAFFGALIAREPGGLLGLVHAPFYFEGKAVQSSDEVRKKWGQLISSLRGTRSTIYGIELLGYDDMVKKYGKPPAKLANVPLRGATMAVANVDGRAEIIALRKDGSTWTVFAFHD